MTRKFSFNIPAITLWVWATWTLFSDLTTWYDEVTIALRLVAVFVILCLVSRKIDLISYKDDMLFDDIYCKPTGESEE